MMDLDNYVHMEKKTIYMHIDSTKGELVLGPVELSAWKEFNWPYK